MHIDPIVILEATMGLLGLGVVGLVSKGLIKKATIDIQAIQNKVLEQSNNTLIAQIAESQRAHGRELRKISNEMLVQRRKIVLFEFTEESKNRMLKIKEKEIEILESGLDLAIQVLLQVNVVAADHVTAKLAELREYRSKTKDEHEAWEVAHRAATEKLASQLISSAIDDAETDDLGDVLEKFISEHKIKNKN